MVSGDKLSAGYRKSIGMMFAVGPANVIAIIIGKSGKKFLSPSLYPTMNYANLF